jgi:hypothetical protein
VQAFSTNTVLLPGDILEFPNHDNWVLKDQIENLTLASENYPLGTYGNFRINFSVNILQLGEYSYLSPRILISVGDTTYFLIFHDNGNLELAVMEKNNFHSNVLTANLAYNLKDSHTAIDVTVCRVFDNVEVYVNDELSMSFPIIPELSRVSLTSEYSVSNFTNVRVEARDILHFFATKIEPVPISFSVHQQSAEQSSLTVFNADSDFAIVDQHLNLPLRNLQPTTNTTPIDANVFFNGWIIKSGNDPELEVVYRIGIRGSEWLLAITYFSIAMTYLLFVFCFSARFRQFSVNIGWYVYRRTLGFKGEKGE